MAASYLSPHHGGGWLFQMAVPLDLQPLLGSKDRPKRVFRKYIKRMPRREAEEITRRLAVEHQAQIRVYRELLPKARQKLVEAGGWEAAREAEIPTKPLLVANQDPETGMVARRMNPTMSKEQFENIVDQKSAQQTTDYVQWRLEAEKAKPAQAAALAAVSWDALLQEWKRIREPKVVRGKHQTIELVKEFRPNADVRKITGEDISEFRDWLMPRTTRDMVKCHLRTTAMIIATRSVIVLA